MSFSKNDLEKIKTKILVSSEIEKKTKVIKKGKDYWCCCPFHTEKTPSCKIDDSLGSFYCFGCGAKGDIFTIYTELYNYTFQDAVKELASIAGIKIEFKNSAITKEENTINQILKISCEWFQKNLENPIDKKPLEYLNSRKLNQQTINFFKIGYSYNSETSLYNYLKTKSFKDEDIVKSNIVKVDKNNKIKDYFYKRIIFPIFNEINMLVGFGGRSIDNSNPKYINSPESNIFQKRNLLFNLYNAKNVARKKNNILICEGYMDVISLYQNGIESVVSPLGTSLTEEQIKMAWKYSSRPTIMFDGDKAGLRASFKSALMVLPLITSKNFIQFITLEEGYDPDKYINDFSLKNFIEISKKPINLVDFIFYEAIKAVSLNNADDKVQFDQYLDDVVEKIKDKKIKYFYKSEFKSLFFENIRKLSRSNNKKNVIYKKINSSIYDKQLLSFVACALNHVTVRKDIISILLELDIFNKDYKDFLKILNTPEFIKNDIDFILTNINNRKFIGIINDCLNSSIYQLFPYASPNFSSEESLKEITNSSQNLNTRLLNLKKINKSLDSFMSDTSQLNWEELQNINIELSKEI